MPDEPPESSGRVPRTFGEFAGIWDEAWVGSPNLRPTQGMHYEGYEETWSADGGVEIRAHTKGFKAMIAARKYKLFTGSDHRPMNEYGANLKATSEVVVYVSKRYRVK